MEYRNLGNTDLSVSRICLGTMTWGEQNNEADAHAQLDLAVERGVNFIDTAELYPVPPSPETQGLTEQWIGNWLRGRQDRDRLVIGTKIAGPGPKHFRNGETRFTPRELEQAVDDSLRRLQTETIDLYQLHWPMRNANRFGRLGYQPKDDEAHVLGAMEETLEGLHALQAAGKIRSFGLSNETPWGALQFLRIAHSRGLPRPQSIQNPYNLLNRVYEVGMAEVSHREACGLLAYSPLAFGVLSGKYLHDQRPAGARLTLHERYARFLNPRGQAATARYVDLARQHDLDPVQMAIAFVLSRSFVTSVIIGATTLQQLEADIASVGRQLDDGLLDAIDAIHHDNPNPCL